MPYMKKLSNGKSVRDYSREEKLYEKKHPERDGARVKRNQARKEAGLKVGDPRHADHKKALADGGSNKKSNIRVVSAKENYAKEVKRKRSKPGNN